MATTRPGELTVGLGPVAVRVPRVAQVPREVAPQGYHSGVVQRYQRASQTTQRLFARLYLPASIWKGWPRETLSPCSGNWWERPRRSRPTRWCG